MSRHYTQNVVRNHYRDEQRLRGELTPVQRTVYEALAPVLGKGFVVSRNVQLESRVNDGEFRQWDEIDEEVSQRQPPPPQMTGAWYDRLPMKSRTSVTAMPRQQSPNNYSRENKIRLLETVYAQGSMRTFKKARRDVKHDQGVHSVMIEPGTPRHHYLVKVGHNHFQYEDGSINQIVIGKPHIDYKRQKRKVDRQSIKDFWVAELLEEWTSPFYGKDRV